MKDQDSCGDDSWEEDKNGNNNEDHNMEEDEEDLVFHNQFMEALKK